MKATCLECDQVVEADEENCRTNIDYEAECPCPGGSACQGDDYAEDHRLDSPTHEPYSNLR